MAIGRISGPMLVMNLERQGLDLSIDGNLIYFDVNQRYVGINTDSPQQALDVRGVAQVSNLTVKSATTGNIYSLPEEPGGQGYTIVSMGGGVTSWQPGNAAQIERKKFYYYINDLPAGGFALVDMNIGIANIVYNLTVSRPCLVEVFSNKYYSDANPYAFLATVDHLTDDGSVLLDDGSVIQQRQYSIFANLEEPAEPTVYARISNIDGLAGNVTISMMYFSAVTDNSAGQYSVNVVHVLPPYGYDGQTVLLDTDGKLRVWYGGNWNTV